MLYVTKTPFVMGESTIKSFTKNKIINKVFSIFLILIL